MLASASGKCSLANLKGDGYCDDGNNNAACSWDGGDCCKISGKAGQFNFCTKCSCLDCTFKVKVDSCKKAMKKGCGSPKYVGDGFCDDTNNRAGCNWDGGDCCGASNYKYCTACKCQDCNYKPKSDACTSEVKGVCGLSLKFKGDGFCDDQNNNAGCNWDGGDCCGATGKQQQFKWCKQCQCKDCTRFKPDGCASTFKPGAKCGSVSFKGDGFCDDNNNNMACNWDGGDCCGPSSNKKYCKLCKCRDCKFKQTGDSCIKAAIGSCSAPKYKGDGFCDDGNNNAACSWDGGDCCGTSGKANQMKFCKKCACRDCTKKKKSDTCVQSANGICGSSSYKGDGFCDDNNNNAGCNWDGGDCCGSSGKGNQYKFCKNCKCRDCTKIKKTCPKKGKCGSPKFVGDGYCDDNNNNCACNWDKGDCCKAGTSVYQYCKMCFCFAQNKKMK